MNGKKKRRRPNWVDVLVETMAKVKPRKRKR